MKAYKATDKNMQCRGLQFELNKESVHVDEIKLCESGFHFCKDLKNVFKYYEFHPYNKFFEIEIPDDAEVIHGENKFVTNKIKFIRELSSEDIKELTNGSYYIVGNKKYITPDIEHNFDENNKFHRVDGPAVIRADGTQEWWQNGKRHRLDGPAIILTNGDQYWYQNGLCHREDGPAMLFADGHQYWYQNDKLHRADGPAVIYSNGAQEFWINGVLQK